MSDIFRAKAFPDANNFRAVPPHPGPYIFQLDPGWAGAPSGENSDNWDSLLGSNFGYVQVSRADAQKYGLGHGIHESEGGTGTFELSVYHQLHCLVSFYFLLPRRTGEQGESVCEIARLIVLGSNPGSILRFTLR